MPRLYVELAGHPALLQTVGIPRVARDLKEKALGIEQTLRGHYS
jgi:hypothetical protein